MRFLRFRLALFLIVILSILILPKQNNHCSIFENYENATYFFYTNNSNLRNNFEVQSNCKVLECGNSFIVSCDISNVKKTKNSLTNILGERVRINNYTQEVYKKIFKKYQNKIVFEEIVDNIKIYYCFDSALEKYVSLFNKKVNIQIAVKNNEIDIGYPLILNGY